MRKFANFVRLYFPHISTVFNLLLVKGSFQEFHFFSVWICLDQKLVSNANMSIVRIDHNTIFLFPEPSTWACHAGCKKFCLPSCKRSCCAPGSQPYHDGMFKDLLNYQDSLPPPPPRSVMPAPPMSAGMPGAGQCAQGCPQSCAPTCQPREYKSSGSPLHNNARI